MRSDPTEFPPVKGHAASGDPAGAQVIPFTPANGAVHGSGAQPPPARNGQAAPTGAAAASQSMSPEARREYFRHQISLFVGNLRLEAALAAEALAARTGMDRLTLLRNGLVLAIARHCRLNPRADTRLAILVLITFLADNAYGMCCLSVTRMCQIFRRSRESIVSSIDALERDGQISVIRSAGMPNRYWPLIPRALAELSANVVWIVDALSNKSSPTRNRSDPPDQSTAPDPSGPPDHHPSGEPDHHPDQPVRCSRRTGQEASSSISPLELKEEGSTAASKEAAHATDPSGDPGQPTGNGARPKRERAAPRTRIAPDWRPTAEQIAWVKASWVATEKQVTAQGENFREYHLSKGNLMADWGAAWRTWWLNDYHRIPRAAVAQGGDDGAALDAEYEQMRAKLTGSP